MAVSESDDKLAALLADAPDYERGEEYPLAALRRVSVGWVGDVNEGSRFAFPVSGDRTALEYWWY